METICSSETSVDFQTDYAALYPTRVLFTTTVGRRIRREESTDGGQVEMRLNVGLWVWSGFSLFRMWPSSGLLRVPWRVESVLTSWATVGFMQLVYGLLDGKYTRSCLWRVTNCNPILFVKSDITTAFCLWRVTVCEYIALCLWRVTNYTGFGLWRVTIYTELCSWILTNHYFYSDVWVPDCQIYFPKTVIAC
jgi:hypothetical protein